MVSLLHCYYFVNMLTFFKKYIHFLLAWLTYWYYGRPAQKLIVVGVTGTKGKSTTCRLIASVLETGGCKVGLLSTVEFQIGEKRWMNDKKMTMLGRGQIQKMLKEMVRAGCKYAVVETSSEGILQYRHYGLHYDISVFTNLGTEHSERHGGFENLKRDKGKIFAGLKKEKNKNLNGVVIPKIIVANIDDENASYYLSFPADEKWGYSLGIKNKELDFVGKEIQVTSYKLQGYQGSEFIVNNYTYKLNIPGEFNIYNSLAAIAVGFSQDIEQKYISEGLKNVEKIPGRMEFIEEGQSFKVIVDYAHEPVSLISLFETLKKIVAPHSGKLIGIVGSDGGGRDKEKRFRMGEISGRVCDYVIITDVNCFDEDPQEIAEMLARGVRENSNKKEGENFFIIIDRKAAITKACSLAQSGDVVAITAKGTEPCIVVAGGKKISWDDRKVAREVLQELLKI